MNLWLNSIIPEIHSNFRTEVYITVEEASGYLVQELGLPEEKAHEIASKCNKNGDGKISKNELTSFVEEVKKM